MQSEHLLDESVPHSIKCHFPNFIYPVLDMGQYELTEDIVNSDNLIVPLIHLEQKVQKRLDARYVIERLVKQLKHPRFDSLRRAFVVYISRVLELDKLASDIETYSLEEVLHMSVTERIRAYDTGLIQQGLEQGMCQGLQQGHYDMLLILLEDRFGRVPVSLKSRLKQTATNELIDLYRHALHIQSIDELFK